MAVTPKSISKYEIRSTLGQGGMGIVYRAYDADVKREVALKTIRGAPDRNTLLMFQKEYEVLKNLTHPNIIEIFDIGEYEEDNQWRPFFVMPLLHGNPLDKLIRTAAHRLTVERVVEIVTQTCRGLHAAHEQGLIHRDIKPSNIFVMSDDAVKVIDFGIAHLVDDHSTHGQKGTLFYMSPEQIEMKTLTPASDIFSLAVVCYEALTQRRPFERSTETQVVDAILHQMPPPISGLNPGVNQALSRVIHKAMAKQSWHRFSTAREFSDTLNRALRNEPIEIFDAVRIQPRVQRATKAFQDGDYEFAGEILGELQAEGHLNPAISELRRQVDQAVRQKKVHQLLESARTRFEEGEDPLALQKVDEVLQLDRDNIAALTLKAKIESRRSERQIESWFRLVQQHIDNHSYSHARQALQNVLQIRPMDKRAAHLLSEVERMAQEYTRTQQEKQRLYQAALDAWQNGEVSSALTKMGGVLDLDRRAPDTSHPEHTNLYQSFYNKVRTEHDSMNRAYAEARKYLADRNYARAMGLCEEYLAKHPGHALLQALKFDIEVQQRQQLSAYILEIDRRIEAEPDLDKCISILQEALALYPGEIHFERSLRTIKDKNDLVNAILARARLYEERGQFGEALGQWEILHTIYGQYPGLNFEIERVTKRRELQSQSEDKARWVEQIDFALQAGEHAQALNLLAKAQVDFPNDVELLELGKFVQKSVDRASEAQSLLERGQE
ncbi:MAG: protein kinase domain-containing protein, partial [Terriglobia bacterium]